MRLTVAITFRSPDTLILRSDFRSCSNTFWVVLVVRRTFVALLAVGFRLPLVRLLGSCWSRSIIRSRGVRVEAIREFVAGSRYVGCAFGYVSDPAIDCM